MAIAAIGGLATTVPASAADPVDVGAADPVDVGAARHGNVEVPPVDFGQLRNDIDTPLSPAEDTSAPADSPNIVLVDDDAPEYAQIAVAAVGGAALTAATIAAVAARRRHLHAV
jgi:hypothetical protein